MIPLVHRELHQIARRHMRHERAGHTLQATALVNEAYVRLVNAKDVCGATARIFSRCALASCAASSSIMRAPGALRSVADMRRG